MAHEVFISHSTKDKPVADAVCATLEGRGIRCWIAPRDILPGQDWDTAIIAAIKASKVMVLLFSSNSNDSIQVHREVKAAFSKGVTVIPLRLDDVPLSEKLEYYMGSVHWLDAITPPIEQHLVELTKTVETLLGVTVRNRPPPPGKVSVSGAPHANSPGQRRVLEAADRPTQQPTKNVDAIVAGESGASRGTSDFPQHVPSDANDALWPTSRPPRGRGLYLTCVVLALSLGALAIFTLVICISNWSDSPPKNTSDFAASVIASLVCCGPFALSAVGCVYAAARLRTARRKKEQASGSK